MLQEQPESWQARNPCGQREDSALLLSEINCEDIPVSEIISVWLLWRRKRQPTQYSCLENTRDGGAWCRLLSMGLQRVGHDWATSLSFPFVFVPACPQKRKSYLYSLLKRNLLPSRSVTYRMHFKKCTRAFRDHTKVKAQTQYSWTPTEPVLGGNYLQ